MPELITRHRDWDRDETRLRIAPHPWLGLTSRHLTRDGEPWIPVSGEIHYSRVPRSRWRERLLLMRSGGVDLVSTYVIWIHHEPERGQADFGGDLDIAAFVELCAELGLPVVLRIGPWVHGEVRNGGFPDWVQRAPVRHRTDDPAYLDLVRPWIQRLGKELGHLSRHLAGIQLENELYDQPGHLLTLKQLAQEAGLEAPLWTATAWGGAELPDGEVVPLYSGYGDGFWVDADAGWDPTFRSHFFFSHEWDDPGVGADVRGVGPQTVRPRPRNLDFPPATCELGGGMATTYHRRVVPSAADIAAVANAKLGSGSAWQGYYMYAGGRNPLPGGPFQESQATGYPNDLPVVDYDFHAAIGAAGLPSGSHAALRRQHAFLEAFGPRLATMPSSLPEVRPGSIDDTTTLRWAVRSDGRGGFVFVNWHQPHIPLPDREEVVLKVEGGRGTVVFGSVRVPYGTIGRWPFGIDVQGVELRWATASALTTLADGTLVLVAEEGVDVELCAGDSAGGEDAVHRIDGRTGGLVHLDREAKTGAVLVIGARDADRVWVLGGRRLVLCDQPTWLEGETLSVRADKRPQATVFNGGRSWAPDLAPLGSYHEAVEVERILTRSEGETPVSYGAFNGRAAAPGEETIEELGREYRLKVGRPEEGSRRILRIDWAGDVAHLCVDGRMVADRFWDGSPWLIDLDTIDGAVDEADGPAAGGVVGSPVVGRVSLRILPLHPDAEVWVGPEARSRRGPEPLVALDSVTLARTTVWTSGTI